MLSFLGADNASETSTRPGAELTPAWKTDHSIPVVAAIDRHSVAVAVAVAVAAAAPDKAEVEWKR